MFRNTKYLSLCLPVFLILTACVTRYKDVGGNSLTAEVAFTKSYDIGYSFAKSTSMIEYSIYPNGDCTKPQRAAFLSWMTSEEIVRRVLAEQPLHLHAYLTDYIVSGYNESEVSTCATQVSFTPSANRAYRVSISGIGKDCELKVTDLAANSTPTDLVRTKPETVEPTCRR